MSIRNPDGSTGKTATRRAISNKHGLKMSQVSYDDDKGMLVDMLNRGAIYHRETESTWLIPNLSGERLVSFNPPMLKTNMREIDLTDFNISMGNTHQRPQYDFSTGFTLQNGLETVVFDGVEYRWVGLFPKVVKDEIPRSVNWVVASSEGMNKLLRENNPALSIYSLSNTKYSRIGDFKLGATIDNKNQALRYNDMYWVIRKNNVSYPYVVSTETPLSEDFICIGNATMTKGSHNLFDFGCKDDSGLTDNRSKIQLAIEYMEWCKSQLHTDSSSDESYFGVSSFHPNYPSQMCLLLTRPRNINIYGGRMRNSSIRYTGNEAGESLMELRTESDDWGMVIKSLGLHAGNKLNYCLKGIDRWYAQTLIEGGCYEQAVLDGIQLSAYMSMLVRVFSDQNKRNNFSFGGPGTEGGLSKGTTTSLHVINCWSRRSEVSGYKVYNELWYSEWSSLGNDGSPEKRTPIAYDFQNLKGCVLNAIGAEQTIVPIKINSYRGVSINGIQLSDVGRTDGVKVKSCLDLGSGFDINISGFAAVGATGDLFDYDVYANPSTGNECITITDQSIRSNRVGFTKTPSNLWMRYPDVFIFLAGRSQDYGFTRTGNVLHSSKGYFHTPRGTGIQETILQRDIYTSIIGLGEVNLFQTPDSINYITTVDIICVVRGSQVSAKKYKYVGSKKSRTLSITRIEGEEPEGWSYTEPSGVGKIKVTDQTAGVEREFIIVVRFSSQDASGIEFYL